MRTLTTRRVRRVGVDCTSTTSVISAGPSSCAELGFTLVHGEPSSRTASTKSAPRERTAPVPCRDGTRLGRGRGLLQLALRPGRAGDPCRRAHREPHHALHRRRNLLAARVVPDAIATVLITGVENATHVRPATRLRPTTRSPRPTRAPCRTDRGRLAPRPASAASRRATARSRP